MLALNIFPHGKTVLHYAYNKLDFIRNFYKTIEDEVANSKESESSND